MPRVHHRVSETSLFCLSLQSFQEFSLSPCWKFQIAHLFEAHDVFDTISAHEFVKNLIFKVVSSITNYSSGSPKSAENIYF